MLIACLAAAALAAAFAAPAPKPNHPVLLGVDGCFLDGGPSHDPWDSQAYWQMLKDMGIGLYVVHINPQPTSEQMAANLLRIDKAMRAHGMAYTLNNEFPNFVKSAEFTPGGNEFAQPDGTHRWDLRMEWLTPLLAPAEGGKPALLGVTYDETEHMQLTSHQFCTAPGGTPHDAPQLANVDGMAMEPAYERLVDACKSIRAHYQGKLTLFTEDVWPDLFHIYARAGWTVTPKVLKENFSVVIASIAMGAALQYREQGAKLWISPDLWGKAGYPGHSTDELRSALLLGYWLGADAVYVENLDYPGDASRHPDADPTGSLIRVKGDGFELTKHGKAVKEFYTSYVPNHPRTIDWRDYRPRVAIVRLPDGAWGQRGSSFRDRLLGNKQHPMDDISAEWLDVWPILTHGSLRRGAISLNNGATYPENNWPMLVPIDSVAVFDHRVTGKVLDGVECFIVCGHALSEATFRDIARRVATGATCVIARRLHDQHSTKALPGRWVVVDQFTDARVSEALQPFLGPPDVARFRFADCTVEFRAPENKDRLEATVTPR